MLVPFIVFVAVSLLSSASFSQERDFFPASDLERLMENGDGTVVDINSKAELDQLVAKGGMPAAVVRILGDARWDDSTCPSIFHGRAGYLSGPRDLQSFIELADRFTVLVVADVEAVQVGWNATYGNVDTKIDAVIAAEGKNEVWAPKQGRMPSRFSFFMNGGVLNLGARTICNQLPLNSWKPELGSQVLVLGNWHSEYALIGTFFEISGEQVIVPNGREESRRLPLQEILAEASK